MAYSVEVRKKVVDAYHNKIGSMREIAIIFSMGISTVNNIISRFRNYNDLKPKKNPGRPAHKLSIDRLNLIRRLVESSNHSTLRELCKKYMDETGEYISKSHMDNALKKLKLSLKKRLTRV